MKGDTEPYPKKAVCAELSPGIGLTYVEDKQGRLISQIRTVSLATWLNREQMGYASWMLCRYSLRNSGLYLYQFEGQFYRPAGLLKIAHDRGNTELTEAQLRNRLGNVEGGVVTKEMLLTPVQHPLAARHYHYLGQDVDLDDLLKMAKQHHVEITKTSLVSRLRQGWSIYRAITTPSRMSAMERLTIQYNQIADLVEKYGREKGLQIWLGQKHN